MEAKLQKKPKRGDYIVQTLDRSYKDNTLLFEGKQQSMLCMPDQIHHETCSHWMYQPSLYKKNLL